MYKLLLFLFPFFCFAEDCINCKIKGTIMDTPEVLTISGQLKTFGALANCKSLDKFSCLYMNSQIKTDDNVLVIYHRGYWGKHKGNVPNNLRQKSIEQALSFYELDNASDKLKSPMLISTSSNVGFTVKEIESAIKKVRFEDNTKIILVAHSGGFEGLLKTLKYLKNEKYKFEIEKIVMLDNFYFNKGAASIFKEFMDKGVKCSGFLTKHNRERYKLRFKDVIAPNNCSVELRHGHNKSVNDCLAAYVKGDKCD